MCPNASLTNVFATVADTTVTGIYCCLSLAEFHQSTGDVIVCGSLVPGHNPDTFPAYVQVMGTGEVYGFGCDDGALLFGPEAPDTVAMSVRPVEADPSVAFVSALAQVAYALRAALHAAVALDERVADRQTIVTNLSREADAAFRRYQRHAPVGLSWPELVRLVEVAS